MNEVLYGDDSMVDLAEAAGVDEKFIMKMRQSTRQAIGVTDANLRLYEEVEPMRKLRDLTAAKGAEMEARAPPGYDENVGTAATPVYISLPVELNVAPAVNHVHVPQALGPAGVRVIGRTVPFLVNWVSHSRVGSAQEFRQWWALEIAIRAVESASGPWLVFGPPT